MSQAEDVKRRIDELAIKLRVGCCTNPAWESTTPTHATESCGKGRMLLQHKNTGYMITSPLFCGRWDCPNCGPVKAEEYFRRVAPKILSRESLWMWAGYVSPDDVGNFNGRVRKRRQRHGTDSFVVFRKDSWDLLISTDDLAGDLPPENMTLWPSDAIIGIVIFALQTPGVARVNVSRGWTIPSRKDLALHRLVDYASKEAIDAVFVSLGTVPGGRPPEGVTIDEYRAKFIEVLRKPGGKQ